MVIANLIKDIIFTLAGCLLGVYVITGNIKVAIMLLIISSVCVGILIGEKTEKK